MKNRQELHDATIDAAERADAAERVEGRGPRRPYSSPRVIDFGDVRDVTLGGTPGVGDSGAPGLFQP